MFFPGAIALVLSVADDTLTDFLVTASGLKMVSRSPASQYMYIALAFKESLGTTDHSKKFCTPTS